MASRKPAPLSSTPAASSVRAAAGEALAAAKDRRQDILQAALQCFAEAGIEAASIDMVRQRCGASVGSIYHHFGSKEGIVAALYFDILSEQAHRIQKQLDKARSVPMPDEVRAGVRALVLGYLDWVVSQPERARFLFQARTLVAQGPQAEELSAQARRRQQALLAWFEPHRQSGALQDIPCELMPSLVMGPVQSYCRAWLSGGAGLPSPRKYRDVLADAACRAVIA